MEGSPSFDAEDLHTTVGVLRELAGTYREGEPLGLVLLAAANIAATRSAELLEARISERRSESDRERS